MSYDFNELKILFVTSITCSVYLYKVQIYYTFMRCMYIKLDFMYIVHTNSWY